MKRWMIFGLVLLFMLASVPWAASGTATSRTIAGLPLWGVYGILVAVLFAVVVAFILNRSWDHLAGEPDDER